jgi:hypothetical protein
VDRVLEPVTRVGDAEREAAVAALGEHFAAGRIDRDELDRRLEAAYAARTRADLGQLFTDLPGPALFRRPAAPARQAPAAARGRAGLCDPAGGRHYLDWVGCRRAREGGRPRVDDGAGRHGLDA